MFERITCKHCINYRNSRCPRREYKDPKLNDIAVGPDDTPCEQIRSKIKGKTAFGSYTLERTKNRVYLIDKDGGVIFSCNYKSVEGPQSKKRIEELTGFNAKDIDKILASYTYSSKNKTTQNQEPNSSETKQEFDETVQEKAKQLVCDPQFFYKLGAVFEQGFTISKINKPRFVIGEERNKRLLPPLIIGASILNMTSMIKLLGPPGTAKDTLTRMTLDLLPIKSVERSYITAASLRYSQNLKEANLLYIPDSPELKGETGRTLRFMRSDDGGLISEYAKKDPETGEMVTAVCTIPIKGVVTTSNAITGDTALQSGMWTLHTNGTPELTSVVKREKLKMRAGKRRLYPEKELEVWKCAFHILLTQEVPETLPRLPFAEDLFDLLESSRSESRRDPDKLCDLISLVAWMRRFQKCPDVRDVADFIDLYTALQIGWDAIIETISELDPNETKIFGAVKEEGSSTCRAVVDATKVPYKSCYRYLEKLVDRGFLNKDKEKGKNVYSVLMENTPKTFLCAEGRSYLEPEKQIEHALGSFRNSSLSHQDIEGSFFDPITGNEIDIIIEENGKLEVEIKKLRSIPADQGRNLKRGTETVSKQEKSPKNLLPLPMRSYNGIFGENKPKNPEIENKGLVCCDCCTILNNVPYTFYFGKPICISCYKKIESQEKPSLEGNPLPEVS
jgi:hypothetical protein